MIRGGDREHYAVAGDIVRRAEGYDIPASRVDGLDFFAVHTAAGEVVARARNGGGPSLLHITTPRYYGHFSGDADTYRTDDEKRRMRREQDCLARFRARVTEAALLEPDALDRIDTDVEASVDRAVIAARAAPRPAAAEVTTDVYASYP